jgi:hypothetical protein
MSLTFQILQVNTIFVDLVGLEFGLGKLGPMFGPTFGNDIVYVNPIKLEPLFGPIVGYCIVICGLFELGPQFRPRIGMALCLVGAITIKGATM